jgi:sugar/nucleoside kinase (ribokinase family)
MNEPIIYAIGNPLIDIIINAKDQDLHNLGIDKGVMHLVEEKRQKEIFSYFNELKPIYNPGGSAPNTILACSALGIPSLITGKIGNDKFGEIYLKQANKFGAIPAFVQGQGSTGSSIIIVTEDGERTMNTHLGMCRNFSKNDIDTEKLAKSKFLYFTGYMWDTESQKTAIKTAINFSKENNIKIIFDVADPFVVKRNKEEFLEIIKNDIDIVFANRSELAILYDRENYNISVNKLSKIVKIAGIKLGKKGSIVIYNDNQTLLPASPITAKDSTGAGDMYAAGFITSLCRGMNPVEAGEIAGHLAEEIIKEAGAQFDINKIKELSLSLF